MNVRWMRSNADLLALLVIVMVVVGVLAVLVARQQQDQATDNGQVNLQAAPAAGASSRANTPDPANVLTKPDAPSPADTEDSAPVKAPAQDQTAESADRSARSDRSSGEVAEDSARVEAPAQDQTSESADRSATSERSTDSKQPRNLDAEGTLCRQATMISAVLRVC
jgi:type IV secretory pathway VirB10-like protein